METTTPGSDATGKEMVPLKDEEFKDPKQDKGPLLTVQGLQGPESLAGKKFRSIQELDDAMKLRWDDNADRHGAPALSRQRPGNEGFGFVARDDGGRGARHGRGDVFLHFSDLEPGVGSSELAVGARVKFYWEEPADAQRGPGGRARRVSLAEPEGTPAMSMNSAFGAHAVEVTSTTPLSRLTGMSNWSSAASLQATPAPRPRHTGRVYRRESLLAVEGKMRSAGHLRDPRPMGVPRLLPMPKWYWDNEGCVSEDETDDEARLRALEARLDRENGADAKNVETFGEAWAVEAWSFEDALAANQRIAAQRQAGGFAARPVAPAPASPTCARASADGFFGSERRNYLDGEQPVIPTMILQ
ncbi:unnamed protein product [Symbiodinium pilosum]|uniref:CSD domain-containing protein n=1 Tax=Symbiodinium pilosum TaxID=2952 RepID=A0A812NRK5_SYMPI|nr:unnamed protein product [Symbiodinium pilosum]